MLTLQELRQMQSLEISACEREQAMDIQAVQVDDSLGKNERILEYLQAVHNPYLFRVGAVVVRVKYKPDAPVLQEIISGFVSRR